MIAAPSPHQITTTEFTRMGEAGIFEPGHRFELIEGEIIEMSPIGRRHAACVRCLINLLTRTLGGAAVVDAQNPLVLGDLSQPQPDLVVLKARDDFYADDHPRPQDVAFLIEVADSSLLYDRETKIHYNRGVTQRPSRWRRARGAQSERSSSFGPLGLPIYSPLRPSTLSPSWAVTYKSSKCLAGRTSFGPMRAK